MSENKIIVEYFLNFAQITRKKREEIPIHGDSITLRELIDTLVGKYGSTFRRNTVQGEEIHEFCCILVNGRDARGINKLDTKLKRGDVVSFFSALAGGERNIHIKLRE